MRIARSNRAWSFVGNMTAVRMIFIRSILRKFRNTKTIIKWTKKGSKGLPREGMNIPPRLDRVTTLNRIISFGFIQLFVGRTIR